ncbi:unnamed protein product [Periconia digitata]|uniref:Uncharacterized protein n=1 Tax=Periconia digitata TaxID=1303443 RepID=A0A9W4XMN0_9PLEO|nr:unnamed protein product [Periconia digitata]
MPFLARPPLAPLSPPIQPIQNFAPPAANILKYSDPHPQLLHLPHAHRRQLRSTERFPSFPFPFPLDLDPLSLSRPSTHRERELITAPSTHLPILPAPSPETKIRRIAPNP